MKIHTNTKRTTILLFAMILLSLIITACGPSEPEVDIEAQRTGFAQTADVQATMTVEARPTATETLVPTATLTSTPEATPTTDSETETDSDAESETTTTPTPGSTGGGSNAARWMSNDPPDKTNFSPGESFTVTWTLENSGTSTWTTSYYIEFASGEQMGAPDKVFVPYPVAPGTNVKISVDFEAPESRGEKQSNWKLVTANDVAFYDFYVIIDVVAPGETEPPTATPTATATAEE